MLSSNIDTRGQTRPDQARPDCINYPLTTQCCGDITLCCQQDQQDQQDQVCCSSNTERTGCGPASSQPAHHWHPRIPIMVHTANQLSGLRGIARAVLSPGHVLLSLSDNHDERLAETGRDWPSFERKFSKYCNSDCLTPDRP